MFKKKAHLPLSKEYGLSTNVNSLSELSNSHHRDVLISYSHLGTKDNSSVTWSTSITYRVNDYERSNTRPIQRIAKKDGVIVSTEQAAGDSKIP